MTHYEIKNELLQLKTDRDYEIAKQTLLEMTGINYEQ